MRIRGEEIIFVKILVTCKMGDSKKQIFQFCNSNFVILGHSPVQKYIMILVFANYIFVYSQTIFQMFLEWIFESAILLVCQVSAVCRLSDFRFKRYIQKCTLSGKLIYIMTSQLLQLMGWFKIKIEYLKNGKCLFHEIKKSLNFVVKTIV